MLSKFICIVFLIAFIITPLYINGQNLIIDPGFEEVERVLDGSDTVYEYKHWTSLLKFKKLSPRGLPIFSHYSIRYKDDKHFKYWIPFEGDSYMFSQIVYFRNLYQTKLLDELIPGNVYKINFKYKVGAHGFPKEKIEYSINNKIGVLLTNKDMSDSSGLRIFKNENISLNPQIIIKSFNTDSLLSWVDFTYYFKADKTYRYFIIGNFTRLIESHELRYEPITGVGYKIDQVSIELVPDTSSSAFRSPDNQDLIITDQIERVPELIFTDEVTDSVRNYYAHINKAEDFIIKNLLDSSAIEYHKAFVWKSSFSRDRRNATRAIQLNPGFDSLSIETFLPSKQTVIGRNKVLIGQIDSIYHLDQLCRNTHLNISKQDSSSFLFVLKALQSEEISEETVGVNGITRLSTILFHLSRYENFRSILTELYKEVVTGNFDNRHFAVLVDSYYENNITFEKTNSHYSTNSIFPLYTKFIMPVTPNDQLELINNNRIRIGLERLQSQYQKQFYNFKFGYKDFEFYQYFNYLPFDIESEDWNNIDYLSEENTLEQELSSKYGSLIIWKR